MNLLIRISLFFGFLSVIACTQILPVNKKIVITIVDDKEAFFKSTKDQLQQEYDKQLDLSTYKKFDQIFEVQKISKEEYEQNKIANNKENIFCFFKTLPPRLNDFKPTQDLVLPAKKICIFATSILDITTYTLYGINQIEEKDNICVFEIKNEKRGELEIKKLAKVFTDIKIEKTKEEITQEKEEIEKKKKQEEEKQRRKEASKQWEKTKSLLLKSSLTGGGFVAIGLVSAYILTRKKQTKPVLNSLNVKNKSNRHTTTTHLFPAEQPK